MALCWPTERFWGGRGHVRLWDCVRSLLSGDNEGGSCPEPSCHGRGHLGDRRGWDRAVEGVMGWGEHRDRAQCAPYVWWGFLAGWSLVLVRMALGAEDGVRLGDPTLCLHLPGG